MGIRGGWIPRVKADPTDPAEGSHQAPDNEPAPAYLLNGPEEDLSNGEVELGVRAGRLRAGSLPASCVSPEEFRREDEAACAGYGFHAGTDAFASCLQKESLARRYLGAPPRVRIGVGDGVLGGAGAGGRFGLDERFLLRGLFDLNILGGHLQHPRECHPRISPALEPPEEEPPTILRSRPNLNFLRREPDRGRGRLQSVHGAPWSRVGGGKGRGSIAIGRGEAGTHGQGNRRSGLKGT
jgi:hypothetical protein